MGWVGGGSPRPTGAQTPWAVEAAHVGEGADVRARDPVPLHQLPQRGPERAGVVGVLQREAVQFPAAAAGAAPPPLAAGRV